MALHWMVITFVKIKTVKNIKKKHWFNILVHNLENLNFPFPYKDWDWDTDSTVAEYKQRLREVNIEMALSFAVNIVINVLMFLPFWWTGITSIKYIIVKPKSSPKSKSQIQVPNPGPKS